MIWEKSKANNKDKAKDGKVRSAKGVIAVAPPSFRRERALIKRGVWPVAGCDEAGRGPLAGPVVAAAVVLDPKRIPKGIDDSKRLTAERREELFEEICATASFAVAFGSPARIDRDNILRASLWALKRAVHALPEVPRHVFVDGRDRLDVTCDCEAVIGGDGLVMSIAAASIIAKVTRDRLMCALAQDCPGYGFESAQGLQRARASRGARPAGPIGASPPIFCPRRGGAREAPALDDHARSRSVCAGASRRWWRRRDFSRDLIGVSDRISNLDRDASFLARTAVHFAWKRDGCLRH